MTPFHLSTSRSRTRRAAAVVGALSVVTGSFGLLSAPAAYSAPSSECPPALAVSDLTTGDVVTGKTVTSGTDPEDFGGEVVGVLEDGIAPGVDMVLVDLESTTVDRVGVWSGMSGSPVYTADGSSLIGAVSYSLGTGPSTIAGVTPAEHMYDLLDAAAPVGLSPRAQVRLPQRLARTVAGTTAAAGSTMRRLRVPVTLSGLGSARLEAVAPALNRRGVHLVDAPGAPASEEQIDIVAGGNLAASMAHGTVTAAAIGTATAVCDDEVLGFGHPMNFSGPATMSLHGARATHIQDDQTLSGFKVANLGAPIGTVDGDRLAGLHATKGALPTGFDITSEASYGARTFTADTTVTVQSLMADMGFANLLASVDKVYDRWSKGTATSSWTIEGLRRNGAPFSFTRNNMYADPEDVSVPPAIYLAEDLYSIAENPGETVTITSVEADTDVSDVYETYAISKVQTYRSGRWVTFSPSRANALRVGRYNAVKVHLTSRQGEPRTLRLDVYVPARALGRPGNLTVSGGYADEDSDVFFEDDFFEWEEEEDVTTAPSASTFPALLKAMKAAPANNEVTRTLRFSGVQLTTANGSKKGTLNRVVSGYHRYRVVGVR